MSILTELNTLHARVAAGVAEEDRKSALVELSRLRRRASDVDNVDWFGTPEREEAMALADTVHSLLMPVAKPVFTLRPWANRTWVTRKGVQLDRIACAWVLARYVDTNAKFKFVDPHGYRHEPGEARFDMHGAEFTHEGGECTFEVLVRRMAIQEPGVKALAEIVHDIDVRDGRYQRAEVSELAVRTDEITSRTEDDVERLRLGFALLDEMRATLVSRGA